MVCVSLRMISNAVPLPSVMSCMVFFRIRSSSHALVMRDGLGLQEKIAFMPICSRMDATSAHGETEMRRIFGIASTSGSFFSRLSQQP